MEHPKGERLNSRAIRAKLGKASFVRRVFVFDTIDSTNNFAKALAVGGSREAPARTVDFDVEDASLDAGCRADSLIVAEEQSAGRGRFGRRWISEKGKNLLFSLLLHTSSAVSRLGTYPLCIAASLAETLSRKIHLDPETKWPNDLLISGKKVCGILVESIWTRNQLEALIVGIGLNVNQIGFPDDIPATSLAEASGTTFDRVELLGAIITDLAFLRTMTGPSSEEMSGMIDRYLGRWRSRARMFGKEEVVDDGRRKICGIALDIGDSGELIVDVSGAREKFLAGDVTVVGQ